MKQQKPKGRAFEQDLHSKTIIAYRINSESLAAIYVSQKETLDTRHFKLVVGVDVVPIHAGELDLATIREQLVTALKSLPNTITLTFSSRLWRDPAWNQHRPDEPNQDLSPEMYMGQLYESATQKQLATQGTRKQKTLRLFFTIQVQEHRKEPPKLNDPLGWGLFQVDAFTKQFREGLKKTAQRIDGSQARRHNQTLHRRLLDAYEQIQSMLRFLRTNLGLIIQPMDEECLYQAIAQRFFLKVSGAPPQYLIVTPTALNEVCQSRYGLGTHLGQNGVPEGTGRYVKLGHYYAGVVTLVDKPGGWDTPTAQLLYLHGIEKSADYWDTECYVEYSHADERLGALKLALVRKQAAAAMDQSLTQGDSGVGASLLVNDAEEAEISIKRGEKIVRCAVVFIVYRKSLAALKTACEQLSSKFSRPALAVVEHHTVRDIWLQSLPITDQLLLKFGSYFSDLDRRSTYFGSEVVGLLPLFAYVSKDNAGVALISFGSTPYYLDFKRLTHTGFFGTTRSGKSVLVSARIFSALCAQMPVIVVDYSVTYVDLMQFLGVPVIDVARESLNLVEVPDTRGLAPETTQQIIGMWKRMVLEMLVIMVIGQTEETTQLNKTIRNILELALTQFSEDEAILSRFHLAYDQGIESNAWSVMPVLTDFLHFCDASHFSQFEGIVEDACSTIQLAISAWSKKPGIGEAISRPSSYVTHNRATLFLLSGLGDDAGAAVMAGISQLAVYRMLALHDSCYVAIDEASILMTYQPLNNMIGILFAEGLKRGARIDLIAQDCSTAYNSPNGPKIFDNMDNFVIGRLQPAAKRSFVQYLQVPEHLIALNAQESFFPNGTYSNWLVVQAGRYTHCRWYANRFILAIAANNPNERQARAMVMALYPNKFAGIKAFAEVLMVAIQGGRDVLDVAQEHCQQQVSQTAA